MDVMGSPALRHSRRSLWSHNPLPNGCLLYLPFWDPSCQGPVFTSIDPNHHICTNVGATPAPNGLYFGGAAYIDLPALVGLTPATGTIIVIVQFTRENVTERLFSSWVNELSVVHDSSDNATLYYDSTEETMWAIVSATGNWVHLAFTFQQSATCHGYEDAALADTSALSATAPTESGPTIGAVSGKNTNFLIGTIQEFGMWDYRLDGHEVAYHHNNTLRG